MQIENGNAIIIIYKFFQMVVDVNDQMYIFLSSSFRFISSVLNVTKKFGFDGLDLDWEFPALFEPKEKEKIHFVQLLYEVRKEFDRRSEKLILSVAAAAPQVIIDQSYDVPEIAE